MLKLRVSKRNSSFGIHIEPKNLYIEEDYRSLDLLESNGPMLSTSIKHHKVLVDSAVVGGPSAAQNENSF